MSKPELSRRKFMETTGKIAAAAAVASLGVSEALSSPKEKSMFVHHVYFWMKPDATKEEKDKLYEGIKTIAKLETVKMSHVGIPADTNRPVIDTSYSFSLLTVFDDKKGHDIYQEHPVHLKFIEDCKNLWTKVQVYDSIDRK
ncbi:MAG TPA: Dabb family protein [Cytophagales bacterium]|nr:Dabb family protein [Cytophagales bacterium]